MMIKKNLACTVLGQNTNVPTQDYYTDLNPGFDGPWKKV